MKPVLLELGLLVALEHHILLQREVQHQAVLVPVLRDVAHAASPRWRMDGMGDVLAAERDACRR